jgi:hypothetical protein
MSYNPPWKRSERTLGKWLMEHDGPDPAMSKVASSTGRVGHITELQYDVASLHYSAENKQQKVWSGLWSFWLQIVAKAIENGKTPLLRLDPTNDEKYVLGRRIPKMHVITEERHAELLGYERLYLSQTKTTPSLGYSKEEQLRRGRGRGKK